MRTVLAFVLVAFGAGSSDAMMQFGYLVVSRAGTTPVGACRVLIDLVIMSNVAIVFPWRDVQRGFHPFCTFAVITSGAGPLGLLRHMLLALVRGEPSELTS